MFTLILGAFAVGLTVMLRTVKSNGITAGVAFEVLEQIWLAVVFGLVKLSF